jgi:hypothetical protein
MVKERKGCVGDVSLVPFVFPFQIEYDFLMVVMYIGWRMLLHYTHSMLLLRVCLYIPLTSHVSLPS